MKRGFTLIEVIMAALLLFLGFLAVAAVFPGTYRGAANSQNHTAAVQLADNVLAQVRALPFAQPLPNGFPTPVTLPGEVEGNPTTVTFTPTVSIQANSAATEGQEQATVTVTWVEGTGVGSAGTQKTFVLQGGISRVP